MKQANNKQVNFVPKRLTQARSAKLLNMSDLAERTNITRQAISQYEKGVISPSPETLRLLSAELDKPERFFIKAISSFEDNRQSPITFRSLKTSVAKSRLQAKTYLEWLAFVASIYRKHVQMPTVNVPNFEFDDFLDLTSFDIEDIANGSREFFGLGQGPLSDVTLLLENNGVIIGHAQLQTKLDGVSAWYDDRPFMVINSQATAVRTRFDVAHELAHLVVHRAIDEGDIENKETHSIMEKQANYFAGAFLMPESSFAAEIYGLDLDSLIRLKERWKVSIAAIIMRLGQLKIISSSQKTRLFQMLSAKGARRHEPLDNTIATEKPIIPRKIYEFLKSKNIFNDGDLLEETGLNPKILSELINIPENELKVLPQSSNVFVLRR